MTTALPIAASQLTFAYSESEDRLTLLARDAAGGAVHVLLTRRLTERLINGLAQLLEQSSPLAQTAPADLRSDIILMEHQDALFGEGRAQAESVEAAEPATPIPLAHLVLTIDVVILPSLSRKILSVKNYAQAGTIFFKKIPILDGFLRLFPVSWLDVSELYALQLG